METELTRKMKMGLAGFKLEMSTQMRTPRYAEEVWTSTGIVDVIRFEDYKEKSENWCSLIDYTRMLPKEQLTQQNMFPDLQLGKCKITDLYYPNEYCHGCIFHKHSYVVGMLITCFECKITVSDFKSPNGHNFHGNRNYYVVPKDIYESIRDLVPDDIGIIVYYPKSNSYKVFKECKFRIVDEKEKTKLLYSAFKKWVDKFGREYWN